MFIGIIIIVAIILFVIFIYNDLIKLKNIVDNRWSQIDVQLQRRFDLIPNLVETVKGYAAHEKELFENVAKAKQVMMGEQSVAKKGEASGELSNALKSLFALSEAYPELKANQNFLELQEGLKDTEDKISFARQLYNDSVTRLNAKIDMFPSNSVANIFNIIKREYFAIEDPKAKEPVKVQF